MPTFVNGCRLPKTLLSRYLYVMTSCDGDPVLTRIDQDVVPHHDVSAAAIARHDAAARTARSASPDLVPDDLDGVVLPCRWTCRC